jgi:hypothetical protein
MDNVQQIRHRLDFASVLQPHHRGWKETMILYNKIDRIQVLAVDLKLLHDVCRPRDIGRMPATPPPKLVTQIFSKTRLAINALN